MQVKQSDRECARATERKKKDVKIRKYVILKEGCWQNHTPFGTIAKFPDRENNSRISRERERAFYTSLNCEAREPTTTTTAELHRRPRRCDAE